MLAATALVGTVADITTSTWITHPDNMTFVIYGGERRIQRLT